MRYRTNKFWKGFRTISIVLAIALVYRVAMIVLEDVYYNTSDSLTEIYQTIMTTNPHNETIFTYYESRRYWMTSNLGTILFKNEAVDEKQKNRTFVVLIWKYWDWLQLRHLGGHVNDDPLDECSVKNCIFTGDDSQINSVDAVIIHIQHGIYPNVTERNTSQRWVFLSDESPFNSFSMAKSKPTFSSLANVFNWSMTYRSDADVPVPYGRTVPLANATSLSIPNWEIKQKDVLVAALISNCGVTGRMKYIRELQKHIKVDVIGKCSVDKRKSCPGSFRADCPAINKYYFYLAFENSGCRQYFTEKIFHNAYSKGSIPIIMGPLLYDCENLLPPKSYLHVNDYASPEDLAAEILKISNDIELLTKYHRWREHFKIVNEHGFFGTKSYHLCRLCEALNVNDNATKEYDEDDLRLYLDKKILCLKPFT